MENKKIKCSSKEHEEIDANSYCRECKIYICNKCEIIHSKLCQNHNTFVLEKDNDDLFTGYCKEENHNNDLTFFCKTHNQLCCAVCLCVIKKQGIGKHKDCDVCTIEEIKDKKKKMLNENIKSLEELSKELQEYINNLKEIFEKVIVKKEELKLKIQKIFTKIRNALNDREDKVLSEIDEQFNILFFKESIIKESEKLPNKIKLSLEKGKLIDKEYKENQLNLLIHNCINIENNINDINTIKNSIKKYNSHINMKFEFSVEKELNEIEKIIKTFIDTKPIFNSLENSLILNYDINKKQSIINWIKEKVNKNEISFDNIFSMSRNGSKSEDFHKLCDNKGPTLIIIKTDKNHIFGGFTPLDWNSKGGTICDESKRTFIFSLDLMKKFEIINIKKKAIRCESEHGPIFGDYDIGLHKDMKEGQIYANSTCNFMSNNNLELTGGKGDNENFKTEELEVYKVIY